LLDVLMSMLRLDFAYARLSDSINGSPVEFVRLTQRRTAPPQPQEIGRALDRWLTNQSANAPLAVPNPTGDGEVRIAPLRLGLMDEIGILVAGSKRADFPTPTETLLLRVAANQALVALQEARQLHEQNRAAEELERRVADRTAQLTTVNEALRESARCSIRLTKVFALSKCCSTETIIRLITASWKSIRRLRNRRGFKTLKAEECTRLPRSTKSTGLKFTAG
jgi:hypothetical protein